MMSQAELEKLNQTYPTSAGLAYLSQGSIFRQQDLHYDLGGKSWFELNLYGITGREFSATELKIFNYIWVSTSYADVRIWPNRIAALGATTRTTPILSLVGGIASCDAQLFVAAPLVNCLAMYRSLKQKIEKGECLSELLSQKLKHEETVFGFGRPLASIDERVPHFVKFLHDLGEDKGFCFRLAFKIEAFLKKHKQIRMNIAALYSAVCADLGFSEVEMNLFVSLLVYAGMPPCYLDTLEKPPGALLPLKCSNIHYTGAAPRKW